MKYRGKIRMLALLVGLTMASWAIVAWNEWLPPLSAEQKAALAAMRQPNQDAVGQRNAWELFWLLPYEVPEAERAEVLRQDFAALDALAVNNQQGTESVAEGRYPRRWPKDAPRHRFCSSDESCLAMVRSEPAEAAAELASAQSELQALRTLGNYDHVALPHRMSLAAPIPPFGRAISLSLLDAALKFDQGEREAALTQLCADAQSWRQLKGRADTLIFEMLNIRFQQRLLQLYADMRAELPADFEPAEVCRVAFSAPRADERMSCDVYRSEFRFNERLLEPASIQAMQKGDEDSHWLGATGAELLINREASLGLGAQNYWHHCQLIGSASEDEVLAIRPQDNGCGWLGRLFNPMGCALVSIALPAYGDYAKRDQDWADGLRAYALAEWLSLQADPTASFAARPQALRDDAVPADLRGNAVELRRRLPWKSGQASWQLPLPGSRVERAQ